MEIMSDRENITDQENIDEFQIEEVSTYPINNNILYRERVNKVTKRSFNYVIIKEGVYPNGTQTGPKSLQDSVICSSTSNNKRKKRPVQQYKIPHGYIVETTWGRASKKKTIRCEIDYINEIPQFRIKYGSNFQYVVFSSKSPSDAAYNYERALKPETKATLSGPLVFGLQLKSVKKARESRKRGNLIKPAINCTSSTLEKCAKKIASKVRASFNNDIKGVYHQSDEIVLKSVEFSVNKLDFQLDYEEVLQPIIKDIQELGHGYELEINNQRIKREIKFLITTFNEYDYARHVHWRIIRERDNPKTTFPVVFLSKYEEYLTIDIVDNLYFYYNISSRFSSHSSNNSLIENFTIDSTTSIDNSTTLLSENSTISIDDSTTSIGSLNEDSTISIDDSTTSIGLLNENLSLTSPPPAYSLSYNSFYISSNFSNITHNTTINISENRQSIIDQQSVTNDRIHFFPSFLSNIPPPPPPPTYQEALDDDRVLFVEGRDQFGNEQVYFGMGRRGSVIRGWL
ncbi:hypothetical protein RhiirA1_445502 [Rhizophagus irregularis]|uniref:Uncharacterized protein n=1 Tax=Rhizophagus irregularis TaxID=588596 RepID=A0A2I1F2P2_9GLOM|nr:hypothetical protein RhiirA1_445502 [Rhizophagus irregularis]PKY28636.1 hypothetical protein RhiirB3_474042 [Rhizophagus irregularis]